MEIELHCRSQIERSFAVHKKNKQEEAPTIAERIVSVPGLPCMVWSIRLPAVLLCFCYKITTLPERGKIKTIAEFQMRLSGVFYTC